jgi:putative ABC transport system ATP-binding protein
MLVIQDLHKSYDTGKSKLHVLKGINLNISEGEFVSIMGSSGSGKSTLLNIIGILDEKDSGTYELDGVPIEHLSEVKAAEYRSKFLGFIFQSFNLIGYKTALENVALPLYYQNVPRKERNQKAMEYLEKVGLAQWANHLPNELSEDRNRELPLQEL